MATLANAPESPQTRFAFDVRAGLCRQGQKELPSKYLYDTLGSTLFEAISLLPEYGLTRADERVLSRYAKEMVRRTPTPAFVSELGSGSGKKTRWILSAMSAREPVSYFPIEISRAALNSCASELGDMESVSVVGVEREYIDGLRDVGAQRPRGAHMLLLFLGSTIGNFDCGADTRFLSEVRAEMMPGDSLLLGTDLLKPLDRMLDAYDDPLGVTAAFNLNLLSRINRELGGNFDLRQFQHLARFNEKTRSIEMHLRSRRGQKVKIPGAGITATFTESETIWTESSRKYELTDVSAMAASAGFRIEAQWVDEAWPFAETLLRAA